MKTKRTRGERWIDTREERRASGLFDTGDNFVGIPKRSELETNFTRVPNEVFTLLRFLDGSETKILLHIVRQTIGWENSDTDVIALSQFEEHTGLDRQAIVSAIQSLESKGIVSVAHGSKGNRYNVRYRAVV